MLVLLACCVLALSWTLCSAATRTTTRQHAKSTPARNPAFISIKANERAYAQRHRHRLHEHSRRHHHRAHSKQAPGSTGKYLNSMQPCDRLKGLCIDTSGLQCSMSVLKGKKYCGTMADNMFFDNVDSLGCCPTPGQIIVKNPLSESSGDPVGRLVTPEDMADQMAQAQYQEQLDQMLGQQQQGVDPSQMQGVDPSQQLQAQQAYYQQAAAAGQYYDPSQAAQAQA